MSKTKDFEVEYDPQTNFKHITIHSSLLDAEICIGFYEDKTND